MKKSFLYPIFFMVIVTIVFISVLAIFNYVTADTIAFNQENELRQKVLYIFEIFPQGASPEEIEKVFSDKVIGKQFGDKSGFALVENNEEVAYAIPINGAGLWGSINGYLGLSKDLTKIIGIEFIKQSETPGLGGRISETEYKEQYRNIDISDKTVGKYIILRPQSGGNIDAISGATLTSTMVVNLVNDDLNEFFETTEVK